MGKTSTAFILRGSAKPHLTWNTACTRWSQASIRCGFDLANITFIKGNTGWIVIDPLTVKETSRAALKFVNEKLGERPVVAL